MQRTYAELYSELYRGHWWWRAREEILLRLMGSLGFPEPIEILDVGCGPGLFLEQLGRFGNVRGIEVDETLAGSSERFQDRIFTRPLGDPLYEDWKFDLITALDVIEHIEDDTGAVDQMIKMLVPGGKLVITVPAFMQLWDEHDVINQHFRRYSRRDLSRLLASRGRLLQMRYLFHGIFLPKWAIKTLNDARTHKVPQHRIPSKNVNRIMQCWCSAEDRFLRWLRIPFGTSLLAVVEKPAGGCG